MSKLDADLDEEHTSELDVLIERLEMSPEIEDYARDIYTDALHHPDNLVVGRGKELIAAAAIVLASYKSDDIIDISTVINNTSDHIQQKSIHRSVKEMRKALGSGLLIESPEKYVDKIADELDTPASFVNDVKSMIDTLQPTGVTSGKKAAAIAAGAYYATTRYRDTTYTQETIAEIVDVSTVTIRMTYNEFIEMIDSRDLDPFN